MTIGLSRVHFPVTTLGPGQRLGIWFQGCRLRCPGCISADTWQNARQPLALDVFFDTILPWVKRAEGITISGGEPFDQPLALEKLLGWLRQHTTADILVYSGYDLEQLPTPDLLTRGWIDALITGPYQQDQPQTLALRGSDNQALHCLTPLGEQRLRPFNRIEDPAEKRLDVMADAATGVIWLAGIPRREDIQQLEALMQAQGNEVVISRHKPAQTD